MTGAVPAEIMQRVVETIPMRRLGRPDEVARVVVFLAEPASAYITGQVYSINGGLNM
jgi:NAD(P)-dependent dehydrogenase (short-subunit alcohol dehydrogenase family)